MRQPTILKPVYIGDYIDGCGLRTGLEEPTKLAEALTLASLGTRVTIKEPCEQGSCVNYQLHSTTRHDSREHNIDDKKYR